MRSTRSLLGALTLALSLAAPLQAQKLTINAKLEDLQAAAVKDSSDPAAHYNLAMGYWSKKKYAQADSALQRAVAIDPQFADGYLALSVVHDQDGDFWQQIRKKGDSGIRARIKEEERNYRKAFMLDPLVDVRVLATSEYFTYLAELSSIVHLNFVDATKDFVEGKYDKAYTEFDKERSFWGGKDSKNALATQILWYHALSAAHTNQFSEAESDMDVVIDNMTSLIKGDTERVVPLLQNEYRYMKATFALRDNHAELALPLFQEVAQNDIGNYMAHVQMARIYEAQRDYADALKERTNALNANPEDPSLMLDRGITLGKSGNMAEAEIQLQAAREANPRDVRPIFWLAIAEAEQGKKDKAREDFTTFLARAPSRYDRQIAMAKDRLAKLQ
jgi:tetratricopeptide (TPR) repeat protein